ncbi:tRNA (cytosine(72)-C(5))-methyltransferase NSUN6-like [Antedon mediterranea]|uniref:tRNA (cytosine(72)-C(5))-methyltransferase NSUN6-like n=1 Tax=Antedon mediterranea TaxID=105859 RepID=UPI003AF8F582
MLFTPEVMQNLENDFCNEEVKKHYKETGCQKRFEKLLSNLKIPPSVTVVRVNTLKYSIVEVKELLQDVLKKQYEQKSYPAPDILEHPLIPDVLLIPSSCGLTDLTPAKKEVVVDLICATAIMRGADIFAAGVMGADSSIQRGDLVSVHADLDDKCRRGATKPYQGAKVFIGNGMAVMSRADVFVEAKSGVAVQMSEGIYDSPSLNNVLPNHMFLQNLPSVVVGHVLNPQPGDTVLDMCAAPGGKTVHIATLMKDEGELFALEKSSRKISKITNNVNRFGLKCVKTFAFDSTKACNAEPDVTIAFDKPPFAAASFDRILLDTPCSALGQRPILHSKFTLPELKSYPSYQRKLFTVAEKLLKSNGVLVYSTCTLTLAENEGLVEWALKTFSNLTLENQTPSIFGSGMRGTSLDYLQLEKLQRCNPADIPEEFQHRNSDNDTIGFFIAKFIKR